jgi:hypothetical protein
MTMRAPATNLPIMDLPILFTEAGILAGAVAILDDISLSIGPGTPTVLTGRTARAKPRCCAPRSG